MKATLSVREATGSSAAAEKPRDSTGKVIPNISGCFPTRKP